jgi:hypothetical protein
MFGERIDSEYIGSALIAHGPDVVCVESDYSAQRVVGYPA